MSQEAESRQAGGRFRRRGDGRPILMVNRKIKRHVEEESHGVWKIAYADFVTALMAFFVLMWLLSATAMFDRQHFNPYSLEEGATKRAQGGVIAIFDGGMMGGSSTERLEPEDAGDAEVGELQDGPAKVVPQTALLPHAALPGEGAEAIARFQAESREFVLVRERLRSILEQVEPLRGLADNVSVEEVPEGLRIQIVDQNGFSMFASGSDELTGRARVLLTAIGTVLEDLPNPIAISGHTDSVPYRGSGYGNWELSADRANAARRLLTEVALDRRQIERVEGYADTRPFIEDDPRDPRNRRISLLILRMNQLTPELRERLGGWLSAQAE
mgnify:CR=1 FL=1